ncbi:MAG: hypothetical protein ACRDL8_18850, partial [Solirubrobacteraceae bacterium]
REGPPAGRVRQVVRGQAARTGSARTGQDALSEPWQTLTIADARPQTELGCNRLRTGSRRRVPAPNQAEAAQDAGTSVAEVVRVQSISLQSTGW